MASKKVVLDTTKMLNVKSINEMSELVAAVATKAKFTVPAGLCVVTMDKVANNATATVSVALKDSWYCPGDTVGAPEIRVGLKTLGDALDKDAAAGSQALIEGIIEGLNCFKHNNKRAPDVKECHVVPKGSPFGTEIRKVGIAEKVRFTIGKHLTTWQAELGAVPKLIRHKGYEDDEKKTATITPKLVYKYVCPSCGTTVKCDKAATVCPHCGKPIEKKAAKSRTAKAAMKGGDEK